MSNIRTHYDNLQIARTASDAVVRAAYRGLSQQHHPDKNPKDRTNAERRMKVINEAYAVLSDPAKRREHDQWIMQMEAETQTSRSDINSSVAATQQTVIETEKRRQKELGEYKAFIYQPVWPPKFESYFVPMAWMALGVFVIWRELFSPPMQPSMIIVGVLLCCGGLWLSRYVQRKSE
jgi:hypothetical protein